MGYKQSISNKSQIQQTNSDAIEFADMNLFNLYPLHLCSTVIRSRDFLPGYAIYQK